MMFEVRTGGRVKAEFVFDVYEFPSYWHVSRLFRND